MGRADLGRTDLGRTGVLAGGALAAFVALAGGGAHAQALTVQDSGSSYSYPADCAAAFENHAAIESHMRARGREGELNEFNHRCSIHLSGNRIGRTGTGIRALGSDTLNEFWRETGARDFVNRLRQ